ncbi:MAG: hypothetical protein O3B13_25585, partial [Planctomycetota bacterium]|nr:hypothetical protein [Planctomycetota bacterium]
GDVVTAISEFGRLRKSLTKIEWNLREMKRACKTIRRVRQVGSVNGGDAVRTAVARVASSLATATGMSRPARWARLRQSRKHSRAKLAASVTDAWLGAR